MAPSPTIKDLPALLREFRTVKADRDALQRFLDIEVDRSDRLQEELQAAATEVQRLREVLEYVSSVVDLNALGDKT